MTNNVFHNIDINTVYDFYLSGMTSKDANAFKWKIYDYYGDILIKCPTYLFAKRYAMQSHRSDHVFFYHLTYTCDKAQAQEFGVFHAADLPFVFGQPLIAEPPHNAFKYTDEDIEFSKQIIKYWTNFAKYGLDL